MSRFKSGDKVVATASNLDVCENTEGFVVYVGTKVRVKWDGKFSYCEYPNNSPRLALIEHADSGCEVAEKDGTAAIKVGDRVEVNGGSIKGIISSIEGDMYSVRMDDTGKDWYCHRVNLEKIQDAKDSFIAGPYLESLAARQKPVVVQWGALRIETKSNGKFTVGDKHLEVSITDAGIEVRVGEP
jgi:hypothetical protein